MVSSINIVAHDRITSNCNNILKYTKYNCNTFELINEKILNIRSNTLKLDDYYILFWKSKNFGVGISFFFTILVSVHCSAYLLEFPCTGAFSRIWNVHAIYNVHATVENQEHIYKRSET